LLDDRSFNVSGKLLNGGSADLVVEVSELDEANQNIAMRGRKVKRELSVYDSSDELVRKEELETIRLKTDGKNPTAFMNERKLNEAELGSELVRPVIEAIAKSSS
jgi:hypothetical protein